MNALPAPRVLFCCVAENNTKYLTQSLRLLQSLRWFGGSLAASDMVVAVVDDCRPAYRAAFEQLGAQVRIVTRVSTWHGPSNKLRLLELAEAPGYDFIVLSDCDVVVLDDIAEALLPGRLRAKPADFETVPDATLAQLFERAGVALPSWRVRTSIDRVSMLPYCNSGFVVVHREVWSAFAARWGAANAWCLQQRDLLGPHEFHCDQASFALALARLGEAFVALPIELNFPGHLASERYPDELREVVPRVLHYHDRVDGRRGGLAPIGLAGVDAGVARFNARLAAAHREGFQNAVFWDLRYLTEPALGSGIGSRGEYAALKRALVQEFVQTHAVHALVDFGCGDCDWIHDIAPPGYIGIDASAEIVERNRREYPEQRFVAGDLRDSGVRGSHSLCFDVLIHQPTLAEYDALVGAIIAASRDGGMLNGFDAEPTLVSDIVFYHEPLHATLARHGVVADAVGAYRDTVIYRWRHR